MNRTIKKPLSVLLAIMTCLSCGFSATFSISAYANQTRSYNFSSDYSYSDDAGQYMVNIAQAQYNRKGSELDYSEDWCADFVADCAELAGQSAAIPKTGGYAAVNQMDDIILSAGGWVVYNKSNGMNDTPRAGDIAFINWDYGSNPGHVEIVKSYDGTNLYTIGGNRGGTGSCRTNYVNTQTFYNLDGRVVYIIRPNYGTPESWPQYPSYPGTINGNVYWIQRCLIDLGYNCGSSGADGQMGTNTKNAIKNFQSDNGLDADGLVGELTWNKLLEKLHDKYPDYLDIGSDFYAYIIQMSDWKHLENTGDNVQIAANGNHSYDGKQVWHFIRQDNGSYKIVSAYDGKIFDLYYENTANGTNIQTCAVTDSNAQRWYIISCGDGYSIKSACGNAVVDCDGGSTAPGTNVQIWEPNGTSAQIFSIYPLSNDNTDLNKIIPVGEKYPTTVYGASPVNIGDVLYAKIKNISYNKYITNIETGKSADSLVGKDQTNDLDQVWRFERYYGNAYKIVSVKDNWVLDVHNHETSNDTPVEVYSKFNATTNQLFYIYQRYGGYYIKPLWSNLFVDMAADTFKISTWATGDHSWAPQEFDIIKLTDHTWTWVVTKEATCTQAGIKTYTCSTCGATKTEEIQPLGHDFGSNWNYAKDYHYHVCRRCILNGQYYQERVPHVWDDGEITVPATCSATGVKTFTCTVCQGTKTDTIEKDADQHTGGTEIKDAVTATCGAAGYTGDTYCKGCGVKLSSGTAISATGNHAWDTGTVITAATGTENGVKVYTCTICGVKRTEMIQKPEAGILTEANVKLSSYELTYNSTHQFPSVTVTSANGTVLTENKDYTLDYSSDEDGEIITAANYTVTVTGIGNYTGSVTVGYKIAKQTIKAENVILSASEFVYNGMVQQPTVTVKNAAGYNLTLNKSCVVKYSADSKAPGTYTVTVTGKGNYTGTVKKTYKINAQPVDASRVTLSATSFTYNGAIQQPTVTVKNAKGVEMKPDIQYTVSYSASIKAPGTYTVTVTGVGYYTGTAKKTYKINAQPVDASRVTLSATSFAYNGKVQQPVVTVKNAAGNAMTEGTSYTVAYSGDCKAQGTYTVTVTGKGYYTGTATKQFTITPSGEAISSSRVTLSDTSMVYNGAVQKPTVTVKNAAGSVMTEGKSYKVTYSAESKYPGTYTVTVTAIGSKYTGTVKKTYKITPQPIKAANMTLSWSTKEYNSAVQKPVVTMKNAAGNKMTEGTSYTVSYSSESKVPGTYKVTVTAKGGYYTGTAEKTYKITPQTIKAANMTLSWSTKEYNSAVQKPVVTMKNAAGNKMTEGTSYTVSYSAGSKVPGTYKVTVTAKGGCYTGTAEKTYKITPQPIADANVTLSWTSKAYNGKVQQPSVTVKNAAGGTMTENVSYIVTYSNGCKDKGTYVLVVIGQGNYTGTVTKSFTIK